MSEYAAELQQFLAELPAHVVRAILLVVVAVLVFLIIYHLTRLAKRTTRRLIIKSQPEGSETLALAGTRIVGIAGVTLGVLASLTIVGIDVGGVMAALGLSTLVLGFALKDIIEQAITGVLLLVQRPFRVGDTIQVEGIEGSVVDVAIRTTNIKTVDGVHALIPNNKIYHSVIKNKSYYSSRRLVLAVGLGPGCELSEAHRALSVAVSQAPGVLADPPSVVAFEGWEQETVRTTLQFWIDSASDSAPIQTAVTQAVHEAAGRIGLDVRSAVQSVVTRTA
jgi:small-conductance mechanosensitive channel